jgi:iron-sulfur cluster insertion protein
MHVSLSPAAASHLNADLGGKMLRIAFTTGCGGSGYRLAFAEGPNEGDIVLDVDGLKVAFDDMAASKLDGAVIEYDEDEDGYTLEHPDAVTAVWCG